MLTIKYFIMNAISILRGVALSAMVLINSSVFATDYSVSSGNAITITEPGSHRITGTGSSPIYITSTESGSVFNITLDNMMLTAGSWASAINLSNNSTGSMTVNFILVGTNSTTGYNHGGIQATHGTVNVVFTTTTVTPASATLTSTAIYSDSYAFRNNGGTMIPSVDSQIIGTAVLNGTSISDINLALTSAFTAKPLVLTLKKIATETEHAVSEALKINVCGDHIFIQGLQVGETYQIYNTTGTCVANRVAKSEWESVSLPNGVFILKTNQSQVKFIR